MVWEREVLALKLEDVRAMTEGLNGQLEGAHMLSWIWTDFSAVLQAGEILS